MVLDKSADYKSILHVVNLAKLQVPGQKWSPEELAEALETTRNSVEDWTIDKIDTPTTVLDLRAVLYFCENMHMGGAVEKLIEELRGPNADAIQKELIMI